MGLIWLLTLVHGALSLGTEVLYLKILDVSFGTNHLLPFVIVAAFIIGMSLGNYWSLKRAVVWPVEIALAAFHGALLLLLPYLPQGLVSLQQFSGLSWFTCQIILSLGLLLPSAIGVGFSYPALMELTRSRYLGPGIHALGAAGGIVLAEHWGFLHWGLSACLIALVLGHLTLSAGLSRFKFTTVVTSLRGRYPMVMIAGVLTGGLQAYFIYFANLLFQPFFYTFSSVVALTLLGLSLGSFWSRRRKYEISTVVGHILQGFAVSLIVQLLLVNHVNLHHLAWPLWTLSLSAWILPTTFTIGQLFPACLTNVERAEVSNLNIQLSVGNAGGLILFPLLSAICSLPVLGLILVVGLVCWQERYRSHARAYALSLLLLVLAGSISENKIVGLTSPQGPIHLQTLFRAAGELGAVYTHENELGPHTRLYQHGFSPLDLNLGWEKYIAEVGAGFSPTRERALVIGLGSGRSGGRAAQLFTQTDLVDLSRNTRPQLDYLTDANYQVLSNPHAHLQLMDGLLVPRYFPPASYDLIILTVDPGYQWQASKLYTHEYFRALQKLLRPTGTLIFWLDHSLTPTAQDILIATAGTVFSHQSFFSLIRSTAGPSYYFVINQLSPGGAYQPVTTDSMVSAANLFIKPVSKVNHLNSLYHPAKEIFRQPKTGIIPRN